MGIRKSRTTTFRRVRSGFATSKHVVKKTSAYVDPLHAKEREQEFSGRTIDPASFMTRKQKKAWRRLSPAKRRQYIRQAEKKSGRSPAAKGVALKTEGSGGLSRRWTVEPETAGRLAGVRLEMPSDKKKDRNKKLQRQMEEAKKTSTGRVTDGRINAGTSGSTQMQAEGISSGGDGSLTSPGAGPLEGKNSNAVMTSGSGKAVFSAEESTVTAGTGGAAVAALAAKKAADRFKKDLSARLAGEQMAKRRQVRDADGPLSSVSNAGVISAGTIIGAALHVAAQFVSGIVTTLSVLVIPIAILATLIGFTLALFTGIGGAVEDMEAYYMGGGQDLVDVAVREIGYRENADGSNKYGTWCGSTMPAGAMPSFPGVPTNAATSKMGPCLRQGHVRPAGNGSFTVMSTSRKSLTNLNRVTLFISGMAVRPSLTMWVLWSLLKTGFCTQSKETAEGL